MFQNRLNNKIRIVMLTDYPYIKEDEYLGGVMQASFYLCKALSKIDEIELYVITQTTHVVKEEKKADGNIVVIYLPYYYNKFDAFLLYHGFRNKLNELLYEIKPHIIHAQGYSQYIFSAIKSKIPHVITIHGLFKNEMRYFKSKYSIREYSRKYISIIFERYYIQRIKNLIAITKEISNIVKKHSHHVRVFRINNAIDDKFFNLTNKNVSPVIFFIAAITYRKGLHILLKAFETLSKQIPDIKCRIAGVESWDPSYINLLKYEYMSYIRKGQVSFLGTITQEQLYEELENCSLLCLPSFAESAPMVIAQAMAAGKPVVATNVGGIPDMVINGVTGMLIEPNNVDMLANCIDKLITNNIQLLEIGDKARSYAINDYYSKIVAQKTVQAYREVITGS